MYCNLCRQSKSLSLKKTLGLVISAVWCHAYIMMYTFNFMWFSFCSLLLYNIVILLSPFVLLFTHLCQFWALKLFHRICFTAFLFTCLSRMETSYTIKIANVALLNYLPGNRSIEDRCVISVTWNIVEGAKSHDGFVFFDSTGDRNHLPAGLHLAVVAGCHWQKQPLWDSKEDRIQFIQLA